MDITEKIKTFQDVLDYNGETLEQFNERTKNDSPDEVGHKKCKAIVLALNEGENVTSGYYPWFNAARSASGFSFDVCDYDHGGSLVGSRLLLKEPRKSVV